MSFDERDAFEATPESRVVAFEEYPRDVPELMLRRSPGTLSVRYIWAYPLGAPDRPRGGVTHLKPGHWCRLLHNGRVAYDGGWSYESTVLNIANSPIGRSLLMETDPLVIDDQRAELR